MIPFKRKKKVPIDVVAKNILGTIMTWASNATRELAREEEFSNIQQEKILFELAILAFWDLNILGYPFDIFMCVVNQFLEESKCNRDCVLEIMERRAKSYFEAWGTGQSGDSLMRLAATITKNIDDRLALNIFTMMYIVPFFLKIDKLNAELLNWIRNKIEIVPAKTEGGVDNEK